MSREESWEEKIERIISEMVREGLMVLSINEAGEECLSITDDGREYLKSNIN